MKKVLVVLVFCSILLAMLAALVNDQKAPTMVVDIIIISVLILGIIRYIQNKQRKSLLDEILSELHLEDIKLSLPKYDDNIVFKNKQTFENYTYMKYFKDDAAWKYAVEVSEDRKKIKSSLQLFLEDNVYKNRPQYSYVEKLLNNYVRLADGFRLKIIYNNPDGKGNAEKILYISSSEIDEIAARIELLDEILSELNLNNIESMFQLYDDDIIVKSKQTFENYTYMKYFKDNDTLEYAMEISEERKNITNTLQSFLKENIYKNRPQYNYVEKVLNKYIEMADGYRVKINYITSAGNNKGERLFTISFSEIEEMTARRAQLLQKEYDKMLKEQARFDKQQEKLNLERKKGEFYGRVYNLIDCIEQSRDKIIIKSHLEIFDDFLQKLDKIYNDIVRISGIDSPEWIMINRFLDSTEKQFSKIVCDNRRISEYYESDDYAKIKETCSLLAQSQREFNEYINEKVQSITKLFGTRIVREETRNDDIYNYVRAYKKTINPFTAEVSSSVFGSAENNPIAYIVKYFYPDKNQYPAQIEKLKLLIEELQTLREAKAIIENYKKDYNQYIQNVPSYVMDIDEAGFYSRLGLKLIDENDLIVEYKFSYTSDGGMAQRSFTVPMNEENVIELINQLENKLSLEAFAKEQRSLMTTKLRTHIKERDNYTCCNCGNSVYKEPNLLLEIDHIIPISKGGLTQESNLQTLCWKCNRNKGAKLI